MVKPLLYQQIYIKKKKDPFSIDQRNKRLILVNAHLSLKRYKNTLESLFFQNLKKSILITKESIPN